jgi:hypothetical protein
MTSERGKRAVENIDDVYDQNDPPIQETLGTLPGTRAVDQSSSTKVVKRRPELRRRPRPNRIRRYRQVVDQSGLNVFLLLSQLLSAIQGAQLLRERPSRRPRTG